MGGPDNLHIALKCGIYVPSFDSINHVHLPDVVVINDIALNILQLLIKGLNFISATMIKKTYRLNKLKKFYYPNHIDLNMIICAFQ